MAASTDLFRKATNNFSTTLSGNIGSGDTTMTLNSVTNLPTDTGIDLVIDRVDANGNLTPSAREYVKGVVSGSNIINMVRGQGNSTAQGHSTGAVVEMVPTGEGQTDMVTGILVEHTQAGLHSKINGNTVPAASDTVALLAATQTLTNKTLTSPTVNGATIDSTSTINATHWGSNNIPFSALLSSIFSGQVTGYSNGGSAGGTFDYINLGGIKILWGVTATQTIGGAAPNSAEVAVTLPASFFTTIQFVQAGAININHNTMFGYTTVGTYTTSSVNIEFFTTVGTADQFASSLLVIGA